jgi:hypothetical protein
MRIVALHDFIDRPLPDYVWFGIEFFGFRLEQARQFTQTLKLRFMPI